MSAGAGSLDVPLVLVRSIRDLLSYSLNPMEDAASLRVDWTRVMEGGGRFALSLAMAFAAAGAHQVFDASAVRRG